MTIEQIIHEAKAYYCLECGICTGSCPLSRVNPAYSPRLMVEKALMVGQEEIVADRGIWSCLLCKACSSRCPSRVDYQEFIRSLRAIARTNGNQGVYTHAGILHSMMELQVRNFVQKRTAWVPQGRTVAESGDYYYFVGCLPHFSVIFGYLQMDSLDTARSALKIFNSMGIVPVVDKHEKCCGHDLYWAGDLDKFKLLAHHNVAAIQKSGAKKVIFTCPECYSAFVHLYPGFVGSMPFECIYMSDFLQKEMERGSLSFAERETMVTYQDPCRLGRYSGIYDSPRAVLAKLPGVNLTEMARNRRDALCCGSSGWIDCTLCNKKIQLERLKEAMATGAETLVTACPKCRIHWNCVLHDKGIDLGIKIKDLTDMVAEAIGGEGCAG